MHHRSKTRYRASLTILAALAAAATSAHAQFDLEDSLTKASLRGIHSVGNGIAWASGTDGTVLRTEDGGFEWQPCTTPPGAEHLDFRGIQAFDENTAIVMSSGKGDLSRLYKTTDGCHTWHLVFTNPDKEGFWDAIQLSEKTSALLLGDPVEGRFLIERLDLTKEGSEMSNDWKNARTMQHPAASGRGAFAASNSSLLLPSRIWYPQTPGSEPTSNCVQNELWFGTSGPDGAKIFRYQLTFPQCSDYATSLWVGTYVPLAGSNATSGVFSLANDDSLALVAVGGDYLQPSRRQGTAAYSSDGGQHWSASTRQPGGYRSAVGYDRSHKAWITVGPNGSDYSIDDGKIWHPLKPGPNQPPDADKDWNALSLPFVVGPHGRIGKLRDNAISAKP